VPPVGRYLGEQDVGPHLVEPGPYGEVRPHPDHVPQPVSLGRRAEVLVRPVRRVARYPLRSQPGRHRAVGHPAVVNPDPQLARIALEEGWEIVRLDRLGRQLKLVAAFGAAFICGIVANLGARYLRIPQPVMLVPALLVLVPGSLSYESVLFAFQQNITTSLTFASNAAFAAVELVAGLLLSQLLFPTTVLRLQGGIGRVR